MNDQPLNPQPAPPPLLAVAAPAMTFAEMVAARPDGAPPILSPLNQAEPPATGDTSTPQPPPNLVPYNHGNRSRRRRHLGRAGMIPSTEAARIKAAQEAERAKKKAQAKATAKMKKRQRAKG